VTRFHANAVALQAARAAKPLPNCSIIMVEGTTAGVTTYYSGMELRGEKNNYAMCLACHKSVASDSFVFTLSKLRE
jgi:hypothetical protein